MNQVGFLEINCRKYLFKPEYRKKFSKGSFHF